MTFTLRPAVPADVPELLRLVQALATHQRAPLAVGASEDDYLSALFPEVGDPLTRCEVAEVDGQVVGMAFWFVTFSTWTGQHGIWLEDLYVDDRHRASGIGEALLARLAGFCVERGYRRLEWSVLDWNRLAVDFYLRRGARELADSRQYRLDGQALVALAARRR